MTEYQLISIDTAIDGESLDIILRDHGHIEIVIRIYDPKTDSHISKSADIANADEVHALGRRLMSHSAGHIK